MSNQTNARGLISWKEDTERKSGEVCNNLIWQICLLLYWINRIQPDQINMTMFFWYQIETVLLLSNRYMGVLVISANSFMPELLLKELWFLFPSTFPQRMLILDFHLPSLNYSLHCKKLFLKIGRQVIFSRILTSNFRRRRKMDVTILFFWNLI